MVRQLILGLIPDSSRRSAFILAEERELSGFAETRILELDAPLVLWGSWFPVKVELGRCWSAGSSGFLRNQPQRCDKLVARTPEKTAGKSNLERQPANG